MSDVVAALAFFGAMTVLGVAIEGAAAYRAYRRQQWRRRFAARVRDTGLRRPSDRA